MIFGIDVHAGYGAIDWQRARDEGGVRFAWLKCTEGNEPGIDAQFARSHAECARLGIPHGAYHVAYPLRDDPAHPGRSPLAQVERAFAACGGLGSAPGELAHMIDVEWPAPEDAAHWGCSRPQISAWLREYCQLAADRWGRKPVIYTYPAWWAWLAASADVSWASEYLLWWADYGWPHDGPPPSDWTPPHFSWAAGTWSDWAVCQFSARGSLARVPGVNACPIDRDCIRTEAMLLRLRGLPEDIHDRPTEPSLIVHPSVPLDPIEPPEVA